MTPEQQKALEEHLEAIAVYLIICCAAPSRSQPTRNCL